MIRLLLVAGCVVLCGCGGGGEREPASDDVARLAYVRNDGGDTDIYVRGPDGGEAVNVTRTPGTPELPGDESAPAWSPDGTMLAYMGTADHPSGSITHEEILVIRPDGSGRRRLTDDRVADLGPHWLADGRVTFTSCVWGSREPPQCRLDAIAVDGTSRETLADDLGFAYDAVVSPDGTHAAFTRFDERTGRSSIVLRDLADGAERRLTDGGTPRWSPDGSRIAFLSDRDENGPCLFHDCIGFAEEVYVMDADGGDQRRLTNDPADDVGPSWTPDGEWIVFGRIPDEEDDYDVYAVRADGSCETRLTHEPEWELTPVWTGPTDAISCPG